MAEWEPIDDSTLIEAAKHDGDTLHLKFKGGREYSFRGVPSSIFQALKDSPSAGSFYHRHIRGRFAGGGDDAGRK